MLKKLRPIQIAAGISFVLGKLSFLPAAASPFIENRLYGYITISLYAFFIFLSIGLCIYDFYSNRTVDRRKKLLSKLTDEQIEQLLKQEGIQIR